MEISENYDKTVKLRKNERKKYEKVTEKNMKK